MPGDGNQERDHYHSECDVNKVRQDHLNRVAFGHGVLHPHGNESKRCWKKNVAPSTRPSSVPPTAISALLLKTRCEVNPDLPPSRQAVKYLSSCRAQSIIKLKKCWSMQCPAIKLLHQTQKVFQSSADGRDLCVAPPETEQKSFSERNLKIALNTGGIYIISNFYFEWRPLVSILHNITCKLKRHDYIVLIKALNDWKSRATIMFWCE